MCIISILAEESFWKISRIEGEIEMKSSILFQFQSIAIPIRIPRLAIPIPIPELGLKLIPIPELTPALASSVAAFSMNK